jgi:hypothetical protein
MKEKTRPPKTKQLQTSFFTWISAQLIYCSGYKLRRLTSRDVTRLVGYSLTLSALCIPIPIHERTISKKIAVSTINIDDERLACSKNLDIILQLIFLL